ncbi:MAG: hypothetical protein L0332_06945 [Chloroflexi bacterium]|nr:hypothetical protein [Chloroflexota bacterium]MCI0647935.1 hypothetical protein [Chloroflexota bacterium]MCI0726445.1 hypothetical protein [Chloroflexota bacterium]
MNKIDLPEEVRHLIQSSVPTIDALEVLIFLVHHPDKHWQVKEIVTDMRPTVIAEPAVKEYLALFQSQGLIAGQEDGSFAYGPTSPDLETAVTALAKAYNERPVTLIRAVYAIADSKKIQSFADAFKIKKE